MSGFATPTETAGRASPTVNPSAVADDIIPLLLASNNLTVNYNKMAAFDSQHRSFSSFEHKFRKWRVRAKEISEGVASAGGAHNPNAGNEILEGVAGAGGEPNLNEENGNVPATKRKTVNDAAHDRSDHGDESPIKKSRVTKQAPGKANSGTEVAAKNGTAYKTSTKDVTVDDEKLVVVRRTTPRKQPVKAKTPVFGGKTGIEEEGETSENEWQPPQTKKCVDDADSLTNQSRVKKAKVLKKGIARVVKKK